MANRQENIFRMRTLLDTPYASSPNLHLFVQQELSEEIDIINELNNTGVAWAENSTQLVSNGFQDTYEISASDFGKPLYVLRATNDPFVPYISVPFGDITTLDYGVVWGGINSITDGFFTNNVTPEKFAFYRSGAVNPINKVRIQPLPQQSATYTISFIGINIKSRRATWLCLCDCRTFKLIPSVYLVTQTTKSCGCLGIDSAHNRAHG